MYSGEGNRHDVVADHHFDVDVVAIRSRHEVAGRRFGIGRYRRDASRLPTQMDEPYLIDGDRPDFGNETDGEHDDGQRESELDDGLATIARDVMAPSR